MKKVEAIIRPEKLTAVQEALESAGYPGITITEIQGHGKQKGTVQIWRGEKYKVTFLPKVKVDIVCNTSDVEKILSAIASSAYTGEAGDGKVFVTEVTDVLRIRTKERGEKALS